MEKREKIKEAYSRFWGKIESLVDEDGWVYSKDTSSFLDAMFEHGIGKPIEFQKSFGRSGENPHWETRGSRWRPAELFEQLK